MTAATESEAKGGLPKAESAHLEIAAPPGFPAKEAQKCFELGAAAMVAANSAGLCVICGAAGDSREGLARDGIARIEMRTFRGNYAVAMKRFVDALGELARRDEIGRLAGMGEIGGKILREMEDAAKRPADAAEKSAPGCAGACGGACHCAMCKEEA